MSNLQALALIFAVKALVFIVLTIVYARRFYRAEFLAMKGWRAVRKGGYEFNWTAWACPSASKEFTLGDAYKRQRLMDERARLELPAPAEETQARVLRPGQWRDTEIGSYVQN